MPEIWLKVHHLISPERAFREALSSGRLTDDAERAIYLGEVAIIGGSLGNHPSAVEREGKSFEARYRYRPEYYATAFTKGRD